MASFSSSFEETEVKEEAGDPTTQKDVPCDSCMENPDKALKSCLTCLVSYCEDHLRPHLENAKFQNHRLVDPLHDVDRQTCEFHHLPLERFCLTDGCCVCPDCESQMHQGHDTASAGAARTLIEDELQNQQAEIILSTSEAEKVIEKLQSNIDSIKSSVQEVCLNLEEQFAKLQAAVDDARRGATEALEGEHRRALWQAEGIQAHLRQRKAELTKTAARICNLSRSKSDVEFLQEYSEWKEAAADVCVPTVSMNHMTHLDAYVEVVAAATHELCDLILSSYKEKLSMISKAGQSKVPDVPPMPDPPSREDFLKYIRCLTFDLDTAHQFLRATEDNRKLTNTSPWQHSYPDHPDRFEYWRQAVTSDSLYLGRHYVEAELSGEGAHVGLTYKSIDRKGEESDSCITGNDFSWCVGRNSRGFSAWHAGAEVPLEVSDVDRVGLYLDFHGGSLSFYDVTGPMRLLHEYRGDFIEPLYVTTWLSKKENTVWLCNAK